jgi:hypothetical protein
MGVLGAPLTTAIAHADPAADTTRTFGDSLHAYNVQLGLDSAGPVLFKDTPDMSLSDTTVFVYGGRLAFLFGDELADAHRIGLAVGYHTVARSDARSLAMISPELIYETGHPLILQVGLGWAITRGTEGFAENYSGFSPSASLRWSFLGKPRSVVSAAIGLTGRVIVATKDFDYSSAYLGAQLELSFHLGDQGGAR